jgi:hypothetical protein
MAEGNGTARWQLWVSLASVGLVLMGALMALYLTANKAADDAAKLTARMAIVESGVAKNDREIAGMMADLCEVETQFRADDQTRNLMHANEMRIDSMLWKRAFGSEYPTDNAYYPTIAQEGCRR